MPIDPNIALSGKGLQLQDPMEQYARFLTIQNAQNQNALAAEEQAQRRNLNAFLPTMTAENRNQLLNYGKPGQEMYSAYSKMDSDAADLDKKRADALVARMKHLRDLLPSVNSPESYNQWRNYAIQQMPEAADRFPVEYSPNIVRNLALEADKVYANHFVTQDLGGTSRVLSMPQYGNGQAAVVPGSESTKTFAPGEARRIAVSEQQLKLDKLKFDFEQSNPGFEVVTQEDGTMLAINKRNPSDVRPLSMNGVPLKGAEKPMNDAQSKSFLFGSRAHEADKILADLNKSGTKVSVPGAMSPVIGGLINPFQPENQQMLDQAKRDFLSAILRRESGAQIRPDEMELGDKQYFPQIGEGPKTIAQKARNRQIAIQGILAEVPERKRKSLLSDSATETGAETGAGTWSIVK